MVAPPTNRAEVCPIEISSAQVVVPTATTFDVYTTPSSGGGIRSPAAVSLRQVIVQYPAHDMGPSCLYSQSLGHLYNKYIHGTQKRIMNKCARDLKGWKDSAAMALSKSTISGRVFIYKYAPIHVGQDRVERIINPTVGLRGGSGGDEDGEFRGQLLKRYVRLRWTYANGGWQISRLFRLLSIRIPRSGMNLR
jgi:hypothetical protein